MITYFAHAVSSYNTIVEQQALTVLAMLGNAILNPNHPVHAASYKAAREANGNGMSYFYDHVLPRCGKCVFMAFPDLQVSAGVAAEVSWFLSRGLPVFEIDPNTLSTRSVKAISPWRVLDVVQTRARLAGVSKRKVIVGFSGGITSAWCAGWALRTYPRDEVVLLWHDTKEEHPDTYRFLHEMASVLAHPITERSHGMSVTELFMDEEFLGNNQQTFCSRKLKAEQCARYVRELRTQGVTEIVKVIGYSANEPKRVARMVGHAALDQIQVRFPVIEQGVTKQETADWCLSVGVKPSAMYCWAEHANCIGCVKGGRAYWLAVAEHAPDVFEQRARLEEHFGHTILRGKNPVTLRELVRIGLKRPVNQKEKIEIGACDCGD